MLQRQKLRKIYQYLDDESFSSRTLNSITLNESKYMTSAKAITTTESRDLILTRSFNAPPEKVFNAWT